MNKYFERIYNGIIKENPTFVLMLGMCPTLAVTTSAINGVGMGLATTVVLIMSNIMISMLRKIIPDRVRMPAYIVVVATFVTVVEMLMKAYFYETLYKSLGLYIALIVVNCIILGRAESYASKNTVMLSMFDGIGMGLGFTIGLALIGMFRELIGSGNLFGIRVLPSFYEPISIFVLAPGAFLVLSMLVAYKNKTNMKKGIKQEQSKCQGGCASCGESSICIEEKSIIEVVNKGERNL